MGHLWGIPNDDSFLRVIEKKGRKDIHWKDIRIGANRLTKQHAELLKQETDLILKSELWKFLMPMMKTDAYHMLYERSQTTEDMIAGKMLLFWQEKIEKTIKQINEMDTISD